MIQRLANLALGDPADESHAQALVQIAAEHGGSRLKQAVHDARLLQEYYLVRDAFWDGIKDLPAGTKAITRIDAAISLAVKASLRGFHRHVFEARGAWPQTIEEFVAGWKPISNN